MQVISYTPHTANEIYGVAFFNFINPSQYTNVLDIDISEAVQVFTWEKQGNVNPKIVTVTIEGMQVAQLRVQWFLEPEGDEFEIPHNGNWNSMLTYSEDSNGNYVYYSLIYWDSEVPQYPEFRVLTLEYSSRSEVQESSNIEVNISTDYTNHVSEDALKDQTEAGQKEPSYDILHPQLTNFIYKQLTKTESYIGSQREANPVELNGSGSEKVFDSFIPGLSPYSSECVPNCSYEDAKLFVSKELGVGYYSPSQKKIKLITAEISGPTLPVDEEYEFYIVDSEIAVFYYPWTYTVYLSSYNAQTGVWSDPLKVYDGHPIIVPSYFNLFPYVWVQVRNAETGLDGWRLYHPLSLSSNDSFLKEGSAVTISENSGVDILWDNIRSQTNYFYVDLFDLLNTAGTYHGNQLFAMLNDDIAIQFDSKDDSKRSTAVKYWYNQLFISLSTLRQAFRDFFTYNVQIGDCGVICRKKGKETVFIPYSLLNENAKMRTISLRGLPEGCSIDNLLFYDGNSISSIITDESVPVTTPIQMKNGVIVQYNSSNWEGYNG